MTILGIETSCDETAAAIIKADKETHQTKLLSNIIASSLSLHAKTGGIIPEVAAREQVKFIIPVIEEAIKVLQNPKKEIDAIAVTVGPGLIGSLLVGVETARTFAYVWNKPIIPVNHLFGHIYANFIGENKIEFPAIALIVSGGHTDLVLMKNHRDIAWLGGTRDDAAGEAFDKTGRLLSLAYPAGPQIEKLATGIEKDIYHFPRPLIDSNDYDFSFSGLKTAVLREIQTIKQLNSQTVSNISYALQEAIFDILIKKTLRAAKEFGAKSILLGGGVASNQTLRREFEFKIENSKLKIPLFIPEKRLCTDNAAMIASAAFFNYVPTDWRKISANPELYFD
ncbi:MAG: tRNA (adenosine(37)-N6)-threonylcarbamoyltransferase complex transferase subunit TsaD [Candidatus Levyibacteriota bacterium]|jgi:N6-L-threonylcarbamoyladenine synthase